MAMYLISDEELNTIIRLRRRDVIRFVESLHGEHPEANVEDLMAVTDEFFNQQVVGYDYLADYAAEELPVVEVEDDTLDGAAVADYNEVPENVDPVTDPHIEVTDEVITVVDDTAQVVIEEDPETTVDEVPSQEVAIPEQAGDLEQANAERNNRISLRALQRELRQIDQV